MAEREAKRARVADDFAVSANDCLTIHVLNPVQEAAGVIADDAAFHPEFTHQIFGDDEEIKGYSGLAIDVYVSQRDMRTLIEVSYTSKRPKADDVLKLLREAFPAGFTQDRQKFLEQLPRTQSLTAQQLGEEVSHATLTDGSKLAVHHTNIASADQAVQALHARLKPHLLFFIDGASSIDAADPRWDLFLTVQHRGQHTWVLGFCTVYSFYAYPSSTRLRLSQILVLPHNQRKGVGQLLLKAVYQVAEQRNVTDVTFEDPTDDLQALRERVDLRRAMAQSKLPAAAAEVAKAFESGKGKAMAQHDSLALHPQQVMQAMADLKITKKQVRQIWEALLYAQPAMRSPAGLAALRDMVQRRLVGAVTSTKQVAENKRIFDVKDSGFVMCRCRGAPRTAGAPIAMETEEEAGQSAEEREAQLKEAMDARMRELHAQVQHIGLLQA
ncbi:hypothetical protein WJX72_004587 [[Myrmecia] bisecta]|uniref:histone acetyltransferase n=1 Tax=[Myrmecia] bisecta TaxID=41462 RepID=A0AAW1PZW6_9CHLO